jgi:hypothetical protein
VCIRGFFYFENHFGHGTQSVEEPSEYSLDEFWTIDEARLREPFELSSPDIAFAVIFKRQLARENPQRRRAVLRLLWNGFLARLLPMQSNLVRSMAATAAEPGASSLVDAIEKKLSALGISSGAIPHAAIVDGLHFPADAYIRPPALNRAAILEKNSLLAQTMFDAECAYIRVLQNPQGASPSDVREPISSIVSVLQAQSEVALTSEYWMARFATFMLPLGFGEIARRNLVDIGKRSMQVFWLVRFAYLLVMYGFNDDASEMLDAVNISPHRVRLDEFTRAKLAELNAQVGRVAAARNGVDALLESFSLSTALARTIAMTAVRMDDPDRVARGLARLSENGRDQSAEIAVLSTAADGSPTMKEIAATRAEALSEPADGITAIDQAGLWLRLGDIERANSLFELAHGQLPDDDYYMVAGAGRRFMMAGAKELATDCLERSKALRPANHMHLDFVGNVYFLGHLWSHVRNTYTEAIALKPYLRSYLSRHAYSVIPETLKSSGVLGKPSELTMIVQTSQDFYHDIGFHIK